MNKVLFNQLVVGVKVHEDDLGFDYEILEQFGGTHLLIEKGSENSYNISYDKEGFITVLNGNTHNE